MTARTPYTSNTTGTMLVVNEPRTVLADSQYLGYRESPGVNGQGRCVALVDALFTQIRNVGFVAGDDDALSIAGDCRGTVLVGCDWTVNDWKESKAVIGYTNADASNVVGPIIPAAAGYAAQFIGCEIQGSGTAARLVGGVWQFIDCTIHVSALAGLDLMDAKVNLISCRFVTRKKPDDAPWWYNANGPCPIRVASLKDGKQSATNLKTRIFAHDCTLDDRAVGAADLCRRFNEKSGYDPQGSVPATCFRLTPN